MLRRKHSVTLMQRPSHCLLNIACELIYDSLCGSVFPSSALMPCTGDSNGAFVRAHVCDLCDICSAVPDGCAAGIRRRHRFYRSSLRVELELFWWFMFKFCGKHYCFKTFCHVHELQFLRLRSLDSYNSWVDLAFIQLQSNARPQAMAVREWPRLALMYDFVSHGFEHM